MSTRTYTVTITPKANPLARIVEQVEAMNAWQANLLVGRRGLLPAEPYTLEIADPDAPSGWPHVGHWTPIP